jgi:hypothetical protein
MPRRVKGEEGRATPTVFGDVGKIQKRANEFAPTLRVDMARASFVGCADRRIFLRDKDFYHAIFKS